MKVVYLVFIMISLVQADWTKDMYDKSNNFYQKAKTKSIDLVTPKVLTAEEIEQERLSQIWSNVFDDLEDGASYIVKLDSAPDSAWFGDDKKDIQKDINKILDDMIDAITGDDLLLYKEKIVTLNKQIANNKSDIGEYREARITAALDSTFQTTKANYDEKIKDKKIENQNYKNDIKDVKNGLKKNFSDIGVLLSSDQIDVLLTRVDGDDIIEMSLVMDVLKHITNQIMQLMKESNEELARAKKYYGMHLITLELVVYIQQKYIDKVNRVFIPKIDSIIVSAEEMARKTANLRDDEEDTLRRRMYSKNLEAHTFALKVSSEYKGDLIKAKNRMIKAQNKSKANLTLSRNTYQTVNLNAELYDLIVESQNMFSEVSIMQMPDIVPFENIQMQKKYRDLTASMQK